MAEVGFERGIRFAVRDRFPCGRGLEERAARGACVRLGSHTLRHPWLAEHRREGGGRGLDLRLCGNYRYRGHSLLYRTIATALPLDTHGLYLPTY